MTSSETFKRYLLAMGLTAFQAGQVMGRRTEKGNTEALRFARQLTALNRDRETSRANREVHV